MPRTRKLDTTGVYLRGKTWWYHITTNGHTQYFSTRQPDQETAIQQREGHLARIANGDATGTRQDVVTVKEILEDYLEHLADEGKMDTRKVIEYAVRKSLVPHFGHFPVSRLTTAMTKEYRSWRKGQSTHLGTTVSDSTVNRELAYLRSAYFYAKDEQTPRKVESVPHFHIVKKAEEDGIRRTFLSADKYDSVRDAMPDFLRPLFVFDYHTGVRYSEVTQYTWDMFDLDNEVVNVPARITKNGKPRTFPLLYPEVVQMLRELKKEHDAKHQGSRWVFSRHGRKIKDVRCAWEEAVTKGGAPGLHFHDLRRTAVRKMRQDGVPRSMRKRVTGHLTDKMEERYDIHDDEDIVLMKRMFQTAMGFLKNPVQPTCSGGAEAETLDAYRKLSPEKQMLALQLLRSMAA